jgi:hypothetical protein
MPQWIHNRAEHILAKNPSMPKSKAFAIATQQSHAVGKSPKGYGTVEGRREAKAKYPTPKDDKKMANPSSLDSLKLAAFVGELVTLTTITKVAVPDEDERSEEGKRRTAARGAVIGGTGALGGLASQLGLARILSSTPTAGDAEMFGKLQQNSPAPIIHPRDMSVKLGPFLSKVLERHAPIPEIEAEAANTIRGGLYNNAAFLPGKSSLVSIGGPDGKRAIVLGEGMPQHPSILSHEMGHADIDNYRAGRLLQGRLSSTMGTLAGRSALSGGAVGGSIGALTGLSDNEKIRALGRWAPMIMGAPQLAYEGGASLLGLARMRRAGASGVELRRAAGHLLPAWGTYAAPKIVGTGAAHLGQTLTTSAPEAPVDYGNTL